MKHEYNSFEQTLQEYFREKEISGRKLFDLEIHFLEVVNPGWRNLWTEKAVYGLNSISKADEFGSFSFYIGIEIAELIVTKKKDKLLVDLMSSWKTSPSRRGRGYTLENSFVVPLN